jgi:UMF1 family MFS transporter
MSRLSARYGNIKVLMGVVVFWILVCVSAYVTAGMAEPLAPYHQKIAALQQQKEALKVQRAKAARDTATVNRYEMEEGRIEGELSKWKADLAPLQGPIEYSFYLLALAVGLVMGGIQSLSRSTYSKLMPETKDTASFFSYYDTTEKLAIVVGMFSFGFIEELTGSMKNSVIFLILFFATGLAWLYSALRKQRVEGTSGIMR